MLTKFNVLLITPWLGIGGEERSTLSIARGLKEKGHNVRVMTTDGPLRPVFEKENIKIVSAAVAGRSPRGTLKGANEIKKYISRHNIDIIHCQSVVPVIMAWLACRKLTHNKPKIIWHCRGIKNISYPLVAIVFNFMTDFVIANSHSEMNRLLRYGLARHRVEVIYNCPNFDLPVSVQKHKYDGAVVGFVGRLAPQKGAAHFIRAAKIVLEKMPSARFIVVGDGPLMQKLKKQTAKSGISDKVEFTGFQRDMNKVYPSIDLLVVPSSRETFGNVAIEAAAHEVPVIASDVGGLAEAVADGETGILVPPGKTGKLAAAIIYLLRNPDLRCRMGQAGKKRVMRHFKSTHLIEELEETYEHTYTISSSV
jgi:glycosyltransferase involved in cell wall biosynthesis